MWNKHSAWMWTTTKLSFSSKLNWKLLYSLDKLKYIVLIKILLRCATFSGLWLHANVRISVIYWWQLQTCSNWSIRYLFVAVCNTKINWKTLSVFTRLIKKRAITYKTCYSSETVFTLITTLKKNYLCTYNVFLFF